MFIRNRLASALFKLVLGLTSSLALFLVFVECGTSAGRLFSTWVLLISAVYFLLAAIFTLNRKISTGNVLCPLVEGSILASFLLAGIIEIVSVATHTATSGPTGMTMALIYATLPILVLCDWLLFVKKGQFKLRDPLYWLALPAFYVGYIIFTAELMPADAALRYPVSFLDYAEIGIAEMCSQLICIAVLFLIGGYILYMVDFATSGELSKHIVMIHLRDVDDGASPSPVVSSKKIKR